MEVVLFEVFMDLWKSCGNLYRNMDLDLLALYMFGPRTVQLLFMYWYHLTMVAKAGRYFGHPSKRSQGVMQDEPLYPTIVNVVVDSVIGHWVKVVTPTEATTGGLGLTIIDLAAYFYAN